MFPALVSTTSPIVLTKIGLAMTFGLSIDQLRQSLDPIYLGSGTTPNIISPAGADTRTALAADKGNIVLRTKATSVNMVDTLPGTGTGVLPAGVYGYKNNDTCIYGIICGSGATLEGSSTASVLLGPQQVAQIVSDGANYKVLSAPARAKISPTVAANIYAASSGGSDTNHGLTTGAAFATMQAMVDATYQRYDFGEGQMIGNCADGTYAGFYARGRQLGVGNPLATNPAFHAFLIKGNTSTPANCAISFSSSNGVTVIQGTVHLDGFKISGSGGGDGIYVGTGSVIGIGNVDYGAITGGNHITNNASYIHYDNSRTISGGAARHFNLLNNAVIENVGASLASTISGTPAFSVGFASVKTGSRLDVTTETFTGSATGTRWLNDGTGSVSANSRALDSVFPGGTAGVFANVGFGDSNPQAKLVVNGNASQGIAGVGGHGLVVNGADAASAGITLQSFGTSVNPTMYCRGARGTAASPTASQSGDVLGFYAAIGYAASGYDSTLPSGLAIWAAENHTGSVSGTYASLLLVTPTTNTRAETVRFFGSGGVGIGTTTTDPGAGGLALHPGSSITPAANGDLVIQATSNTSLTFKYKGSDGTVRSVSLTLA